LKRSSFRHQQFSLHHIVFTTLMKAASLCVTHLVSLLLRKETDLWLQIPVSRREDNTDLCCVSAVGTYVPPMIIYPRKRTKLAFLDQSASGSLGVAAKTGWIKEQLSTSWFDHFLKFTQSANCNTPTFLILDGRSSHVNNISIIMKAQLSLPSHHSTYLTYYCVSRLPRC